MSQFYVSIPTTFFGKACKRSKPHVSDFSGLHSSVTFLQRAVSLRQKVGASAAHKAMDCSSSSCSAAAL